MTDDALAAMVDRLVEQGVLRDARVEQALRAVPRQRFVPDVSPADAHADSPVRIGEGQTASAPHMVAIMAEALDLRPGQRVLEVGGGSGYHAAILARLVAPGGRVVTIERHASLASEARLRLGPDVDVVVGDGSLGLPERAPFDRISVACGAPDVPHPLVEQLAPGGILLVPIGPRKDQRLVRVVKRDDGSTTTTSIASVRFVPLIGRHGWPA